MSDTDRRYGVLNWTLDEIDRWTRNELSGADMLIGRRTVADLVARIRELETDRAELARREDVILAWETDNSVTTTRSASIAAWDGEWEWNWSVCGRRETINADGNTAPTYAAAMNALYDSLVAAEEITPAAAAADHATPGDDTE